MKTINLWGIIDNSQLEQQYLSYNCNHIFNKFPKDIIDDSKLLPKIRYIYHLLRPNLADKRYLFLQSIWVLQDYILNNDSRVLCIGSPIAILFFNNCLLFCWDILVEINNERLLLSIYGYTYGYSRMKYKIGSYTSDFNKDLSLTYDLYTLTDTRLDEFPTWDFASVITSLRVCNLIDTSSDLESIYEHYKY